MSEYEKHSMSEKNEEETLEENADETGGLTKEELDEILADGGMMSRSGGNRRSAPKSNPKQNLKKEPKQKKLRRVLLIVFLVLLVITGVIAAYAYFSTNVYQDDAEFKNYADKQFRGDQLFELNGKTERTYEYGSPISYAADYTVIDNKEIEAFRKTQIDKITAEYKDAQESAEAQRAEENKDDQNYKAPAEALILSSAAFSSDNGAVSIAISAKESQEQKKDMVDTTTSIYTYLVSEKTGSVIYPEQMFVPEYRQICAEYFAKYFKETYKSDELAEGWESHVTADAANFNKFIVSEKFITFYFDSGTILDESEGIQAVKVSKTDLNGIMREKVSERYIDPNRPMVALTYDDGPGLSGTERSCSDIFLYGQPCDETSGSGQACQVSGM